MRCARNSVCWKTMEPLAKSLILDLTEKTLVSPFVCKADPECDGYGAKVFKLEIGKEYIEVLYSDDGFCRVQKLKVGKKGVVWEEIREIPRIIYEKLPVKVKKFVDTLVAVKIWRLVD